MPILERELRVSHPFASKRIITDGRSIFLEVAESTGEKKVWDVDKNQHYIIQVMKDHLDKIAYDSKSDLAVRWTISPGVEVNPRVAFGAPVIEGTRTTTQVVYSTLLTYEDDVEAVAELLGITPAQVRAAVDFEDSLRN